MEIESALWVARYRPKTLDELVLPDRHMKDFRKMVERQELVNLLFSGPPGGGKTTIAKIFCSDKGVLFHKRDNLLTVNGSAQESRGIGFVDKVIVPFLLVPPASDKFKVVFIDEADNLTPDSYRSLRGIIEKFSEGYGRFIFTCNYPSKIPDPLHSRFTHYKFRQIPRDFLMDYTQGILKNENVEFNVDDIDFIIEGFYPDVRKIINSLQKASWEGKLVVDKDSITTSENNIIANIVEIVGFIQRNENVKIGRAVGSIIDIVKDEEVDYKNIYTTLFFMDNFPAPAKIIVNEYSNKHQGCLIPHQHLLAMVYSIIKSLMEYKRMMTK